MPPKIQPAAKTTFDTDDKRAQYARLVAFNFGVKEKIIEKGKHDVNSVPNSLLSKALDSLANGTLLDGKDGIELIQTFTKAGAEDEKVKERGLTTAYAQEVRPFLKRKTLSPSFGRRARQKTEKPAAEKKAPAAKKESAAKAKGKGVANATGQKRGSKPKPAPTPAPEVPETPEESPGEGEQQAA